MRKIILTAALVCAFLAAQAQEYYEKQVTFPVGATLEQKVDMASRLVPTPQQLAWQQMEFTAFLHFGINTFTGNEWGSGKEDPAVFNPTELDCEQWVRSLKEGGFKMAIITAKHHDGFCLWPTKTTKHSVANSPWKNGKGDVVRELRDACDKYGIKFGVYLSPWDRNAECYGDSPAYNKFFIEQLTELLTNYGEVHEVWFDGANGEGPNGKKQIYDWDAILKTIRRLQPKAVTAIMGDDVRWVGNEGGLGRATEWSATALMPNSYPGSDEIYKRLDINAMSKDLGSRELISKASHLFWYPSEVDVSIRPGWFYHAEQDKQVRSLANLVNIYYHSVGCNSVLLLNIPPDKRGLIHENDVKRIKELAEYIKKTFADNKVEKGKTAWTAQVGDTKEYKVRKNALANTFLIQEDITKGQRVEGFTVEVFSNGAWHHAGKGTTVGYKRLLTFSDSHAEKVRVTVTGTRGDANISNIGLYYAEPLIDNTIKVSLSDIPVDDWKTVGMDATAAIDGKQETVWKTDTLTSLVVDMGKDVEIAGFSYTPAQKEDLTGTIEALVFPKVLERVSTELMPDTAVVLGGRLSVREEEDPKLLLDTVEPLYTDAELSQMSDNGALSPAIKQLLPGNTLYLRLPSDSAIGMIQPVLQRFSGPKPVILYIESTGAKLRAPQNLFISPTQELIDTLSDMLGAKNVVLK